MYIMWPASQHDLVTLPSSSGSSPSTLINPDRYTRLRTWFDLHTLVASEAQAHRGGHVDRSVHQHRDVDTACPAPCLEQQATGDESERETPK